MLLLCPTVLAQQSTSITALNELGPENAAMAQRAGLWDVIETTWTSPTSAPTRQNLVAERRMVGSFLEEVLEPFPNASRADTGQNPQWEERVLSLTNGRGGDQVLEVIGGDSLQRSIKVTAVGGHVAIIGLMDSPSATIQIPSLLRQITLDGISVGSRERMAHLLDFMQVHQIKPVIDATYGFSELPEALEHLDRGPFGKVVLEAR
jgi:threonine dehydrogenase-like Zn-dependent dehydrogenase